MESRRQLDLARCAAAKRLLFPVIPLVFLSWSSLPGLQGFAQTLSHNAPLESIKKLFEEERWCDLVAVVEATPARGVEINYYYGSALAQLGRWDEARTAFLAGQLLQPEDERFPIELGGVAFKQRRYSEAARWLRLGLRLAPGNAYGNDFLATIYFLQGNLEAALKYWNRIAKPPIKYLK